MPEDTIPPRYEVINADIAVAQREKIFLFLLRENPEQANRWLQGLLARIDTLSENPRLHPVAPEQVLFGRETRRLLYYGPGGRQGRNRPAWRILYTIIEPVEDEAEGTILILRVLHSNQDIMPRMAEADAND